MATKTFTQLYSDNPVTSLADGDLFAVAQASGPTSGAIKKSDLASQLGVGTAQLPQWTYTSGTMADGLFTANSAAISTTTSITFSRTVAGAGSNSFADIQLGARIVMVGNNFTNVFTVVSLSEDNGNPVLGVGCNKFPLSADTWVGDYTLSMWPSTPASQLPSWTYTAGPLGAGLFTTDQTAIDATQSITLAATLPGGPDPMSVIQPNATLYFVDASRNAVAFTVISATHGGTSGDDAVLTVISTNNWPGNWSAQRYTLSALPTPQTAANVGLVNVPNVDATDADNLSSGTIPDARFPATLPAVSGVLLTGLMLSQISGAQSMASQDANSVDITNGSATLSNLTTGNANITGGSIVSSILTGDLPAISGAALTVLSSASLSGALPAIDGSVLTGITVAQTQTGSGITPCPDGTVTLVTSITTVNGIITAIS